MYPGPENSSLNHKGVDSVRQVPMKNSGGGLPPWPQPHTLFSESRMFHPRAFLSAVRCVHKYIFMQGLREMNLLETEAFVELLASHIEVHDDSTDRQTAPTIGVPNKCPTSAQQMPDIPLTTPLRPSSMLEGFSSITESSYMSL
ncbi:hypothetical protein AZE42_08366 [Rhizopogon vesiculosus]|uniref:Uncharacterized protein n=1 Tax=Rhizopogon vesiculosus TaxID=180088 RepID=A0A1J8PPT8_9AGAM|nr:hypothetical protein AZE42_08366 [Rhizopogon vesiculosus]